MNVTRLLGKASLAAAFAMGLLWAPNAEAFWEETSHEIDLDTGDEEVNYVGKEEHEGWTMWFKYDAETKTWTKHMEEMGNPDPFGSDPYDDKPPGHVDGPSLGSPNLNLSPKVEPNLTKWSKEGFQFEKSMGIGVQGQGSLDDLINPGPDDTGGGMDDDAELEKREGAPGPLSDELKGLDLEIMALLGKEQIPGARVSMVGVDYVRLHNPAPTEGQSQSQGDGGDDSTPATDAASMGASGKKAGMQSLYDAALQSLINPDPFGPGSEPFGLQDLYGMIEGQGGGSGGSSSGGGDPTGTRP